MEFNLEAISLNHAEQSKIIRTKFGKLSTIRYKTKAAQVFRANVKAKCQKYKSKIKNLVENFDPYKNYFAVEIWYYTTKLFTRDKKLSARSGDLDNLSKNLIDVIFDQLTICSELVNDAYTLDLTQHKRPSHCGASKILVNICKKDLDSM